jgi:hypothetical protein
VIVPKPAAGPQLSSKDLNRIKELLDKFPFIEDSVNRLLRELKDQDFNSLKDKLDALLK